MLILNALGERRVCIRVIIGKFEIRWELEGAGGKDARTVGDVEFTTNPSTDYFIA